MPSYIFPGFPCFVDKAAEELGLSRSAGPAGRIRPLTDLANLCAQAAQGERSHVEAILARASEFRDHLATALRAAELMLADVATGRLSTDVLRSSPEPEGLDVATTDHRPVRKGSRNERASS